MTRHETPTQSPVALGTLVRGILEARRRTPASRSTLVAITGIDGCGKGFVTARLAEALRTRGARVAVIGVDGWLNLPHVRFNDANPAEHFYRHAIRFDGMFDRLVFPLRDRRSLRLAADFTEETATSYRTHVYEFENADVILLEGIYLLKRAFHERYDVSVWIDCTFRTALQRALGRAQEGLPPEATIEAYRTIYFPAQEIHFERDLPKSAATLILSNDPRLG
jgi:uridine kinase